MKQETYNSIGVLCKDDIFTEFSSHAKKINDENVIFQFSSVDEIIDFKTSSFDVIYFDKLIVVDDYLKILTNYCKNKDISLVEIVEGEPKEKDDYSFDYTKIYFPVITQDLSLSLYLSTIYRDLNFQIRKDKEKNEEIMISLANSNVRAILLSEALQKLRVSENVMSMKGGFTCYISDFLNSVKSSANIRNAYFLTFGKRGEINQLYDCTDRIKDLDNNTEVVYLAGEIYGASAGKLQSFTDESNKFSFEFTKNDVNYLMTGRQIFVNKKLYGAVIAVHLYTGETAEYFSNENSVSMMSSELEKSLERVVLSKKLSVKNKTLFRINSRMDFLLKSSPAILFNLCLVDYLKFEFLSENIEKLTGYKAKELMKNEKIYPSIIHKDDISQFYSTLDNLESKHSCVREYRIKTKLGRTIWVHDEVIAHFDSRGEITDIVGYLVDIDAQVKSHKLLMKKNTELEEAYRNIEMTKEQLLQSDKLASIGQLAAGVAHEINNPVGYISSNLSTLNNYAIDLVQIIETIKTPLTVDNYLDVSKNIQKIRDEVDYTYIKEDLPELLEQSLDGVTRVKRIVQDLKDFSHANEEDWQLGNLHKGIDSTLNIINNEIKYKAEVIKEYGNIPEIECIPSQLNQVFMNLLVNAGHAIVESGTIVIKTWKNQEKVFVSITDSGKGIEEENLKRLFDPFFTTKPVGEGTGLGLSLSYGIVDHHNGEILVESTLGKGTTFTVSLPITQEKVEKPKPQAEEAN